jgi:hypothetical protein
MIRGICNLCGIEADLHEGHIEPKFAYKRYITGKGGKYFDTSTDRYATKQYTAYMFCQKCENVLLGDLDRYGAAFLGRFENDPYSPHFYEDKLLRWATSLSFRVLLNDLCERPDCEGRSREALDKWRDFLLGRTPNLGVFTQHGFLRYYDEGSHFQKMLEWDYIPEASLTYCKLGPLVVFGVTRPTKRKKEDRRAAEASTIKRDGGYIQRIEGYVAGVNIPSDQKRVADERNIRLLEDLFSSHRRGIEVREQLSEWQRLEVLTTISRFRLRGELF